MRMTPKVHLGVNNQQPWVLILFKSVCLPPHLLFANIYHTHFDFPTTLLKMGLRFFVQLYSCRQPSNQGGKNGIGLWWPNPNPPAVHCGVGQFHTILATASASDCLVHSFTMHLKDFWKFSLTEMMFLHSAGYLSLFQSKIIFYLFRPLLSQTLQEELRLMRVLWGFQVATKSQLIELRVPSY